MYLYCIFLRGINVNGVKIKMAELKKALVTFGYNDPKTILASGNIILSFNKPLLDLPLFKKQLENQLSRYFDYEAYLFVRDFNSIEALVISCENLNTPKHCHTYALIIEKRSNFKLGIW